MESDPEDSAVITGTVSGVVSREVLDLLGDSQTVPLRAFGAQIGMATVYPDGTMTALVNKNAEPLLGMFDMDKFAAVTVKEE